MLADVQPNAGAMLIHISAVLRLAEQLEQVTYVLLLHADPCVGDLNEQSKLGFIYPLHRLAQHLFRHYDFDFDVSSRRKLDPIADQVDQQLLQPLRVSRYLGWSPVAQLGQELDTLGFSLHFKHGTDASHQLSNTETVVRQLELCAGCKLGEVLNVLDHRECELEVRSHVSMQNLDLWIGLVEKSQQHAR